jgi:surface antigen
VNPVLVFTVASLNKKQIYFVMATIVVIVSLPVIAVFSLGTSVLSLLSGSSSASAAQSEGLYQGPLVQGDTYAWGNCTYWVFYMRQQAKDPIPTSWGNANTWAIDALLQGYIIDHTPTPNAIMQTTAGDLGHVAYVTAVDPTTGAWTISEMNVKGLDVVDTATYPASAAQKYSFIHDKETPLL